MKRIIFSALMFILILVCGRAIFAQSDNALGDATQKTAEPVKKAYEIGIASGTARPTTFVLEDVETADFNGVKCLKGKDIGSQLLTGKVLYLSTEKILFIVEYDSLSQYKETHNVFRKKRLEKAEEVVRKRVEKAEEAAEEVQNTLQE